MLHKIILVFCLFFVFFKIEAQHPTKIVNLVKTKDNVDNIYQNDNSSEIFRHYSNVINTSVLDMGIVSDLLSEDIQEGIIWENGSTFQFSKGEHFLTTNNEYILTAKNFRDTEKEESFNEIRRYTITQRSLLEFEEKLYIPKDDQVIMLDNGNFIVTNYSKIYGTEFNIYSDKMELLRSYNPFLLGFGNLQFAEKNNILLAVIYPTKTNQSNMIKMLYISTKNGALLREKEIYNNFSTSKIFAINDLFILYGAGWLNAFQTDGTIKWDRAFDKPVSIFEDAQGKCVYMATNEKIYCLKKENGKIEWSKKISNYYKLDIGKKLESVVNINVIPIGIYSLFNGSEIGLIVGQTKDTLIKSNLKHRIILFRLDKNGELLGQMDLVEKSKIIKVIPDDETFKVITDNQVTTYSK